MGLKCLERVNESLSESAAGFEVHRDFMFRENLSNFLSHYSHIWDNIVAFYVDPSIVKFFWGLFYGSVKAHRVSVLS